MTCPSRSGQHTRATDYSNHGCRCDAARDERNRERKQRHLRPSATVPAIGARRRLQALMAIGYSQNELALQLGRKATGGLGPMLWDENRQYVRRSVYDRVLATYDGLWRRPSAGPRADLIRLRAEKRGWPTPLELDDDRIDDPTYRPTLYRLTPEISRRQERENQLATIETLSLLGLSSQTIAKHVGLTNRSVVRHRARLRHAS